MGCGQKKTEIVCHWSLLMSLELAEQYPYPCQFGETTDFLSIQFMQNIPFNGAGGDWLLTKAGQS